MGLNEQLKADLETGRMKFASAAAELQTIKDEIDQVAQNLSPEEQKWVGEASSDCQERLRHQNDHFQTTTHLQGHCRRKREIHHKKVKNITLQRKRETWVTRIQTRR